MGFHPQNCLHGRFLFALLPLVIRAERERVRTNIDGVTPQFFLSLSPSLIKFYDQKFRISSGGKCRAPAPWLPSRPEKHLRDKLKLLFSLTSNYEKTVKYMEVKQALRQNINSESIKDCLRKLLRLIIETSGSGSNEKVDTLVPNAWVKS